MLPFASFLMPEFLLVLLFLSLSIADDPFEVDSEVSKPSGIYGNLAPRSNASSGSQVEDGYSLISDDDSDGGRSGISFTNTTNGLSYDVLNDTFQINTTDVYTIRLVPSNDLALSILAGQTTNNHTGNETLDDLVNEGRGLLAGDISWAYDDPTRFGNYVIINCGSKDGQPSPVIKEIEDALRRIQLNLIPVIHEIKSKNTASTFGFKALFSTGRRRYVRYITQIYEKILTGASARWRPGVRKTGEKTSGTVEPLPPQIVCLRNDIDNHVSLDGYETCIRQPKTSALNWEGTTAVGLCPSWFQYNLEPTQAACPIFTNGALSDHPWNNDNLHRNREASLLHELVHIHIGHDPGVESYMLKLAMALSPAQQRANPANYAYFYSCKSPILTDASGLWMKKRRTQNH